MIMKEGYMMFILQLKRYIRENNSYELLDFIKNHLDKLSKLKEKDLNFKIIRIYRKTILTR